MNIYPDMWLQQRLYRQIKYRSYAAGVVPLISASVRNLCLVLVFSVYAQGVYCQDTITADPAVESDPAGSAALQPVQTLTIATHDSYLRVYVGRAGLLSRMGHNHVIVSRDISGMVELQPPPGRSIAKISIPPQQLIVDDPQERRIAGAAYTSRPSESDRSATRLNMLGKSVLDAENYPNITAIVEGTAVMNAEGLFAVTLDFRNSKIRLEIPAQIQLDGETLVIDTHFSLAHQDLGLTPYSVMGGMLRVAEQIDFDLHVEAFNAE